MNLEKRKKIYTGKEAIEKYVNTAGSPQATLTTCTINRQNAKLEGEIQQSFSKSFIAEVYMILKGMLYIWNIIKTEV